MGAGVGVFVGAGVGGFEGAGVGCIIKKKQSYKSTIHKSKVIYEIDIFLPH